MGTHTHPHLKIHIATAHYHIMSWVLYVRITGETEKQKGDVETGTNILSNANCVQDRHALLSKADLDTDSAQRLQKQDVFTAPGDWYLCFFEVPGTW